MQKKDDAKAEETFKKILALSPDQAQVSYWLGSVILRQKNVARYSEAIYDIARSVMVTTGNPLPAAKKQQTEDFLKKLYANYHGDDTGLDQVKTRSPPPLSLRPTITSRASTRSRKSSSPTRKNSTRLTPISLSGARSEPR